MVSQKKGKTLPTPEWLAGKAIESLPDWVYIIDKDCTLISCNRNFGKVLGIDMDDASHHHVGAVYHYLVEKKEWPDETVADLKKADIEVLLSAKPVYEQSCAIIANDHGDTAHYMISREPLIDDKKQVQGLLVVVKDVTEQLRLQGQVETLSEHLQALKKKHPNHAASEKIGKKAPSILIIEDNPIAQKATQALFMQSDCVTEVIDSDKDLKKHFKPGKFDLVLLDIGLPNTSGYVMAKYIRNTEAESGFRVPIVAITGFDPDVVCYDCDYYQMDGVMNKPIKSEQARQLIECYIFDLDVTVDGLKTVQGGG